MKNSLKLLLFFSLIYFIYSTCPAGKVKVAEDANGDVCGDPITDCTTYDPISTASTVVCAVCSLPKVPATGGGATCVACDSGKETKDGKACYTIITDCAEYATDGKCTKCTGKIPKSDGTACEACPDGKETKDGKTCVDKTTSSSSFIKISTFALLYLLNIL